MNIEPKVTPPPEPPAPTVEIVVTLTADEARTLKHVMGSNSTEVTFALSKAYGVSKTPMARSRVLVDAYMSEWFHKLATALDNADKAAADVRR